MDLSIIIPTKLAHEHIIDALKGIRRCTDADSYEVIIIVNQDPINNPGVKKGLEMIDDSEIKVIWPGKDLGIAGAINLGLSEASGEYIFITNDDIELKTKKWFKKYVSVFEKHPAIGTIGFMGCDVGFQGRDSCRRQGMKELVREILQQRNSKEKTDAEEVAFHHTASIFSTKKRLQEVGNFDEVYWPYGCEDEDLGLRMLIHGFRNLRVPLKYIHYGDRLGISKKGGATHNLIKERDIVRKQSHGIDVIERNRTLFHSLSNKK